jgi:uncharacterized membrane protein YcgQ (UPF0703/DUF1980 family)
MLALILLLTLMLYGCAHATVKEINSDPDKYMGKKIVVSGTAIAPIQFGQLSGFTLKEGGSTIMVSSDVVPKANSEVTVKGTLVKGMFSQQYIFAEDVEVTSTD